MDWKIVDTLVPAAVTAAIATSAINATSNAYSSRSWPSSLRTNDFTAFTSCMASSPLKGVVHRSQGGAWCGVAAFVANERPQRRVAARLIATGVPRGDGGALHRAQVPHRRGTCGDRQGACQGLQARPPEP